MKTKDFTILSVGLLSFSLTVKYKSASKSIAVNTSALIWEWVWGF